ncbi:unnamed protein product [Cylicocyclus nassatus]|uniref:Uncharacterized protein n=1 Tax=Cylicocyclus nassatus TaxID=53992 RepID=A0AA36DT73_CYLNA|nr:unnamed protein product [Cylicocyclus nassatus]
MKLWSTALFQKNRGELELAKVQIEQKWITYEFVISLFAHRGLVFFLVCLTAVKHPLCKASKVNPLLAQSARYRCRQSAHKISRSPWKHDYRYRKYPIAFQTH